MFKVREDYERVKKGMVFGTRTVLGIPFDIRAMSSERANGQRRIYCVVACQCGDIGITSANSLLKKGKFKGCHSCFHESLVTHGQRHTVVYSTWCGMLNRCTNQQCGGYENYGGRGINVCEEWIESFDSFAKWAADSGQRDELEIDRIDVNGNYEPSNCRWVTTKENCRNKRTNVVLEAFGERKCIAEWAEDARCCVSAKTLAKRIQRGMAYESAIVFPSQRALE